MLSLSNFLDPRKTQQRNLDGREFLVTSPHIVSIQGEDGRAITNVDISPFITNLPGGVSTSSFSTQDASGSTSMAAGVIEVLVSQCSWSVYILTGIASRRPLGDRARCGYAAVRRRYVRDEFPHSRPADATTHLR